MAVIPKNKGGRPKKINKGGRPLGSKNAPTIKSLFRKLKGENTVGKIEAVLKRAREQNLSAPERISGLLNMTALEAMAIMFAEERLKKNPSMQTMTALIKALVEYEAPKLSSIKVVGEIKHTAEMTDDELLAETNNLMSSLGLNGHKKNPVKQ